MRRNFKLNRVTAAVMIAITSMVPARFAMAGPGFGDAFDLNNNPFIIQSYFASSPAGTRLWTGVNPDGTDTGVADPLTGAPAGYDPANRLAYKAAVAAQFPAGYSGTGKAIRKFVDTLPLPAGHALASKLGNKTALTADAAAAKYIPVGVPKKWTSPAGVATTDDYYEIASVEYSEKLHSDLRKATTLRGYVQIDQEASNGRTALPGSKALALYYPNSSGKVAFAAGEVVPADAVAILIAGTDANGKLTGFKVPALVVDAPHYLGPVLNASQNVPTRVKFLNLLPIGRAEVNGTKTITELDGTVRTVANVVKRNGDIFLPLDPSVPGSGFGPDGAHTYSQNRVNMHLHGGDNPWISDGGPHTWITPAGEADATVAGSIASLNAEPAAGPLDPTLVPEFLRGPGALNVPDMNDPGPGAMTYYFPNGQSARMEWYHDHTVGITRLNVYAGLASAYMLTDAKEQDLIARKVIPGPDDTIPLILQDKTFVPDDIFFQDMRWDTAAWGAPGDMWFPHVYETVQDPNQATNFNAVGRWHWGPWFWPSFPSAYNLPSGTYGDVTLTPEAWQDTPLVNGVAYPTITVEPKPYRMRILNASNDRTFSFNMFVADSSVVSDDGRTNTEMKMVPINSWLATTCADPAATRTDGTCTPQTWTTDVYGHNGGVPDATTQGPTLYQIASEGGLLPGVAVKDPTPLQFLLDKGRAAVLNVDFGASGLLIGNAERADVVVDFSAYAGKTLLVYNDNGAPVPAADPRNEYFTGYGDNSATGGAEDTRPGYGPNSRTIMQIVVAPAATGTVTPVNPTALDTEIKAAYKATQETPIVAQSAYNSALGTTWNDTQAFAPVYTGSLKQPTFQFVPGTPSSAFNSILMQAYGSGYTRTPSVTLAGGGGSGATAKASLKIDSLYVVNPGAGYVNAPVVTLVATQAGSGAGATATLKVTGIAMGTAATGTYTSAPTVAFSKPTTPGGVQATGTAVIAGGKVTGITITNPGSGYATMPTITLTGGTTGAKATAKATGSIDKLTLDQPDPTNALTKGGGGYDDLSTAASEPNNPTPGLRVTFTAPPAGGVAPTAGATGKVFDITMTNFGTGYTSGPSVTVVKSPNEPVFSATANANVNYTPINNTIVAATAATDLNVNAAKPTGSFLVKTKAIQELFDPTYGRLNATFGVEVPFTSSLTQTTIPLGYVDAPTEDIADGETQIWKITHNGVDTHPIHFHLVNVQLINRVGWDNFISPPEPNELGWKETIKMSPLEDVIVAVRAKKPKTPGFGLPNSVRLLDPSQPEGAMTGFTQIDAQTGLPAPMSNTWQNFGWEYVWHCHILGHEENDFMRPIAFHANEAVPLAPSSVVAAALGTTTANLSWVDNSTTEYTFRVERAPLGTTAWAPVGNALANATLFSDTAVPAGTDLQYRVVAVGAAGEAASGVATVTFPPVAPANLQVTADTSSSISLAWTDSLNEASYSLVRTSATGTGATTALAANTATTTVTGLAANTAYSFSLTAINPKGTATAGPVTGTTAPLAVTGLTASSAATGTTASVNLSWTNANPNLGTLTSVVINGTVGGVAIVPVTVSGAALAAGTQALTGLAQGAAYSYTVTVTGAGGSATSAAVTGTTATNIVVATPGTPTATIAFATGTITLAWADTANNETAYLVQRSSDNVTFTTVGTVTRTAAQGTATGGAAVTFANVVGTTQAATTFYYRIVGQRVAGGVTTLSTPSATISVPYTLAAPTALTVTATSVTTGSLSWRDNSVNEVNWLITRTDNGGASTAVATVFSFTSAATNGTVTWPISGLVAGHTYVYSVVAAAGVNNVVKSAPVSATLAFTVPAVPAAPTATVTTGALFDTVVLNWAAAAGATSYTVQYQFPGIAVWNTLVTNTTALTFTQINVLKNATTNYSYRVLANNPVGSSSSATTSVRVN